MTSAIGGGTDAVPFQQRITQLQSRLAGTSAPSTADSAGSSRVAALFGSDGANQAGDKLAKLAGALGVDSSALVSALSSGDPTRVTSLITTSSLSALTGSEAASDPTGGGVLGSDASSSNGSTDTGGLQSQLSSLGRTGVQFDGRL